MENKIYYLFGSAATSFYYDSELLSLEEMAKAISVMDYSLFVYDERINHPSDLLSEYDGWDGFAEIEEKLHILLTTI